jgi:hypothetical protein
MKRVTFEWEENSDADSSVEEISYKSVAVKKRSEMTHSQVEAYIGGVSLEKLDTVKVVGKAKKILELGSCK